MSNINSYIKTKDYLVTKEEFNLVYDAENDMLITKPQPSELSKYYDPENYISHNDQGSTLIEKVYQKVKTYTLNKKVKLINRYSNLDKTILDIGCGTGEFLIYAKNKNWDTYGIEINNGARKKAEEKKIRTTEKLEDISNKKFNVITLWHVLEHLPNLEKQIKKIESLLTKNGTLIIAVPNYKSYDALYYKEHWAAYDTPRHLWHFSQKSISNIFQKNHFTVVETLPMHFDSYYVSLLSEKYKNGKTNYIKAIYRGWLSNMRAKSTGEYSSLIYILQKQ
ncbi:class I SAM-dependent methyltransferase [Maribacter hydrothermalis]|uniref:Methyltransferase n=1 Tax=Maribacter hydrothermalis TaxID=1836467 RepID=A0A1B7Z4D8_9FLAO|nr:class I SAM-dependent methyltransferase [Maribacter hydrothermalis]APQ17319.1 methyltransferase [Maribacter hydrothermalis]OBR37579.1 methyltransferase [Maribacter hydrothermalis]